jgi:hypothetical protein
MIRKSRPQGSAPRAAALVAAVLSLGASGRVFPDPSWWEIALRVEIRGGYVVRTGGRTCSGDFSGRARWFGVLERDGEDFLLYRTNAEILDWSLRETERRGGKILAERDGVVRPAPVLNYVLRRGAEILLDFRLEGFDIPLAPCSAVFPLPLPRSAESARAAGEPDYDAEVREGSNAIVLSETDVGARPSEKTFRWTWESRRWALEQAGAPSFTGRHTAEVVVSVVPRS